MSATNRAMTACPNCGSPVEAMAKDCPDCGRLLVTGESEAFPAPSPAENAAPARMLPPILPTDAPQGFDKALLPLVLARWEVAPLPGGSVRLTRSGAGRGDGMETIWAARLGLPLFAAIVYLLNGGIGYAAARPMTFWAGVLLLILACFAGVAWTFLRTEEIRAGRGFVERNVSLFGYNHTERLDGMAVLRVITSEMHTRSGRRERRALRAENLGRKILLDSESELAGFALSDFLGMSAALNTRPDEMTALAKYLSALTGWPVIDPQKGIY